MPGAAHALQGCWGRETKAETPTPGQGVGRVAGIRALLPAGRAPPGPERGPCVVTPSQVTPSFLEAAIPVTQHRGNEADSLWVLAGYFSHLDIARSAKWFHKLGTPSAGEYQESLIQ